MKSRRKIWSLPLVLVTALVLVGLFGAAVLAVGPADPPEERNQIPDQTLAIGATGTVDPEDGSTEEVTVNLADVNGDGPGILPAFDDFEDRDETTPNDPDPIVYTVITTDTEVAKVSFVGEYPTGVVEGGEIVEDWWDALDGDAVDDSGSQDTDCDVRAMRLGFSLSEKGDGADADDPPIHVPFIADDATTTEVNEGQSATGYCRSYDVISLDSDFSTFIDGGDDTEEDDITFAVAIRDAFHWDMLSASEMNDAADAGGAGRPTNYEQNYGALSEREKQNVRKWFTDGTMARGVGTINLDHDGIDGAKDLTAETPLFEGKEGEATVTVKVSDTTGRLIPPATGSRTIGQSFKVTAKRTPTGSITPFVVPAGGTDPGTASADTNVMKPSGSGNLVTFVPADSAAGTAARYEIRIGPSAEKIALVTTGVTTPESADDVLAPHHQKLNFSLSDGSNIPFQILKLSTFGEDGEGIPVPTYNMAEIMKKPGTTLVAGTEYNFKLTVNELQNAPANSQAIDVRVMLVLDNVPPEFNTGQPTTATVVERKSGSTIATFVGSDANHQAVTFAIRHKVLRADRDADQDEIDNIKKINDDADAILEEL